jgi:hypothetical protein
MRAESFGTESELALFSRFSRAFTHSMRGDLSVITNELSYLATKLPSGELDRASNRCSQMASTISKIAGLQSEALAESISIEDLSVMFGARNIVRDERREYRIDRMRGERLALMLRYLFGEPYQASLAVSDTHNGLCLTLVGDGPGGRPRLYRSWSSFSSQEKGERYVVEGVVADLLTRAFGWTVSITAGEGASLASIQLGDLPT